MWRQELWMWRQTVLQKYSSIDKYTVFLSINNRSGDSNALLPHLSPKIWRQGGFSWTSLGWVVLNWGTLTPNFQRSQINIADTLLKSSLIFVSNLKGLFNWSWAHFFCRYEFNRIMLKFLHKRMNEDVSRLITYIRWANIKVLFFVNPRYLLQKTVNENKGLEFQEFICKRQLRMGVYSLKF